MRLIPVISVQEEESLKITGKLTSSGQGTSENRNHFQGKTYQKPGDHPNFRKNALGVKGPFSELSERSGVFSEFHSRNWKFHSRNTKFHSRNGLSRLDQYETHNSRSNSRSDFRNCRGPTRKVFICPCFLGAFFSRIGAVPARQNNVILIEGESEALGVDLDTSTYQEGMKGDEIFTLKALHSRSVFSEIGVVPARKNIASKDS